MNRPLLAVICAWLATTPALGADPPKVNRTITKEPAYRTKAPKYGLLVLGPTGQHQVWLVQDGDTLYVDRNGNGDLTDPGARIAAKKPRDGVAPEEGEFTFEIGDLTVGGQTHKGFRLSVAPLAIYVGSSIGDRPDVKAVLAKDPKATVMMLSGDVAVPDLKGGGIDGRVSFLAGFIDLNGVLRFADTPATAPVIHFGGPLEVTFYGDLPTMRVGRASEFVLVVGTPGAGPGTFAMVAYTDTVPQTAKPAAEVAFQPARPGAPPVKEKYEILERC
jgi:hypothetical protein